MGMTRKPASERLREWRMERGLKLIEVAELFGCSEPWVSLIERGIGNPGVLRVAIEEHTGIPARDWPTTERKKRRGSAAA